jgi:hypothetical protein
MGIDPNWAKDPKIAYKTINAWVEEESSRGKISYSISMKDDSPVCAGFVGVGEILPATNGYAPARSSRATERVCPGDSYPNPNNAAERETSRWTVAPY